MTANEKTQPIIAFIGAGNMAKAIITGLVKSGYPAEKIIATNRTIEKLQLLSSSLGINTSLSNAEAASKADVIILAVKPAVVTDVCKEMAAQIDKQLIISVAAGITIKLIRKHLNTNNAVVRAMPNTPCLLSKGTIGIFAEQNVKTEQRDFIDSLFNNVGEIIWIASEQQMDIVTALSGSGPAYYFYLTEALIKAGVDLGLEEEVSSKLVNQTALGAVTMLTNKPLQSAKNLREAVTSPNGTTAAALKVFDESNLMNIVSSAIDNATNRGIEMSKQAE
ncbi:MAG: pyrroline-5-carboxylate reductase [Enterobacterales bacterium]|jgi:pyrroline-5-carboxylate reductase